jgi:hypothetical protein
VEGWRVIFFLVGGVVIVIIHVVGVVRIMGMGVKHAMVRWKRGGIGIEKER